MAHRTEYRGYTIQKSVFEGMYHVISPEFEHVGTEETEEGAKWLIDETIDEEEAYNRDCAEYDEATGNTAQDRYIEQNAHALRESDRYEQFRNEY